MAQRERDSPSAASLSARATRLEIRLLGPESRLSPEIRVLGHSRIHEQKCFGVAKRVSELPNSESIFMAVPPSMPRTSVKSIPHQLMSARLP